MRLRSDIFDTLLCILAVLGLGCSLIPDFRHVATIDYVATDFKTLYASATLLRQHQDPYSLASLPPIFQRNGVVEPTTWFGRYPVYPPFTLALLAPLTRLSMSAAAQVWFALSLLVYACALAAVLAAARRRGLALPWRIALLVGALIHPYIAYALNVGNASVLCASLAICAWMTLERVPLGSWVAPAALLTCAVLLKPHLALWVILALLLFAGSSARTASLAAVAFSSTVSLISAVFLASRGTFQTTYSSYAAILAAEQGSGSMSPASRELLPLPAQFTALQCLTGLFFSPIFNYAFSFCALLLLAGCLLWAARATRTRPLTPDQAALAVSAVVAFGLLATYHRAHDSILLLPLFLWNITDIVRPGPLRSRIAPTAVLLLFVIASIPVHEGLFAFRQAALLMVCLTFLLVCLTCLQAKKGGMNGTLFMPGGQ